MKPIRDPYCDRRGCSENAPEHLTVLDDKGNIVFHDMIVFAPSFVELPAGWRCTYHELKKTVRTLAQTVIVADRIGAVSPAIDQLRPEAVR
jgi:hypothetical protein